MTEQDRPRVVLVHGFNVRDGGAGTVDKLAPYLEKAGFEVDKDEADYGWHFLFSVRFGSKKAIRRLAKAFEHRRAAAVITHSNGAYYATKALAEVADRTSVDVVVHLSPALNRSYPFPRNVRRFFVWFTRLDFWVKVGSLLLFHPWGSMGAYGPSANDDRIHRINAYASIDGHSDYFTADDVDYVAGRIIEQLRSTIEQRNNGNSTPGSGAT